MSVIALPEPGGDDDDRLTEVWDFLADVEDEAELAVYRRNRKVGPALEGLSDVEVMAMIRRRRRGRDDDAEPPVKQAEFAALDNRSGAREERDFHVETLDRAVWTGGHADNPALAKIARVVLVHRLREVVAQIGFTRFEPIGTDVNGELDLDLDGLRPAALSADKEWFPAIEQRGEGVLVVFEPDHVEAWSRRPGVRERARCLREGCERWAREHPAAGRDFLGEEYVMLHTLAHMLLTRIALDCGYPAASLHERVYALREPRMYGILLHTGSPDSEGTLGGLVEAGRRMGEHLVAALAEAGLCSNDPVCAEHRPDGEHDPMRFHGAACHGCLLIAEPSCEQGNDWLDRALVVPTIAVPEAAFFDA